MINQSLQRMLAMQNVRLRNARDRRLGLLEKVSAAERELTACQRCVQHETQRFNELVAHMSSSEVWTSPQRYTDALTMRDLITQSLERESYLLGRAQEEHTSALQELETNRLQIARNEARQEALQRRLSAIRKDRRAKLERASEIEIEESAIQERLYAR